MIVERHETWSCKNYVLLLTPSIYVIRSAVLYWALYRITDTTTLLIRYYIDYKIEWFFSHYQGQSVGRSL